MKNPFISVVVPTYRRRKYLKRVLEDLAAQSFKDFEVIVVDQSDQPIEKTRGVRCLAYSPPSIVRAKNYGISKAGGKVILVLDDDIRVPKDTLAKYAEHYRPNRSHETYSVAGPALEKERHIIKRGGHSFGEFSIFGELNTDYRLNLKGLSRVTAVPGLNLSFRKSCWEVIGGYDENFKGNCVNEDSDFCLRLTKKFGKIVFDPEISVKHLRAEGGSRAFGNIQSAQWYQDLFYNHLYFYLKHWPRWTLPLFFAYRMRQVYTCIFKYGKLRPKFVIAPLKGYLKAIQAFSL
jgi:glycosyltransferase involved in cell wall biosynthesis